VIIYNTYSEFMHHKQQWQVTLFLILFKELAQNLFTFANREESLDTLARLGITVKQAKEEILGLTYQDYYRGRYQIQVLQEEYIGNLARLCVESRYS